MYAGYYGENYDNPELSRTGAVDTTTPTVAPTAEQKTPWYENPGFWSKVGGVGAALLPKWKTLKYAGEYASNYHNAQQLDRANKRMLSNIASGLAPMEGFTEQDTMGLTPQQIAEMTKFGEERKAAGLKEERDTRLADSTIAYQQSSAEHMKKLDEKVANELKQEELFKGHIEDIKEGRVESKYINAGNVDLFKSLGPKRSAEIIEDIVKEEEKAKRMGRKTSFIDLKDKIKLVDDATGFPINEWKIGQDPNKSTSQDVKGYHLSEAEKVAFREMLPSLKEKYFKTFGNNAKTAAEFDNLRRSLGSADPLVAANARDTLIGMSKEITDTFHMRVNDVAKALQENRGIPIIKNGPPADVSLPPGAPPDQKVLDSLVADYKKANKGKLPTIQELKDLYINKTKPQGGK